jgi:NAD(P)-dependent dehydrogenase (short-subunit alcohol dehydrogenase family)
MLTPSVTLTPPKLLLREFGSKSLSRYSCQLATRLFGSIWVERGFKEGSIVFTSSMSSQICNRPLTQVNIMCCWTRFSHRIKMLTHKFFVVPSCPQAFYNASKAATSNLAKCLACEWAPYSIRVNCLSPGFVETAQTASFDPKIRKFQEENTPLGRYSKPAEQAPMAILLLSNHASYMTGQECQSSLLHSPSVLSSLLSFVLLDRLCRRWVSGMVERGRRFFAGICKVAQVGRKAQIQFEMQALDSYSG